LSKKVYKKKEKLDFITDGLLQIANKQQEDKGNIQDNYSDQSTQSK